MYLHVMSGPRIEETQGRNHHIHAYTYSNTRGHHHDPHHSMLEHCPTHCRRGAFPSNRQRGSGKPAGRFSAAGAGRAHRQYCRPRDPTCRRRSCERSPFEFRHAAVRATALAGMECLPPRTRPGDEAEAASEGVRLQSEDVGRPGLSVDGAAIASQRERLIARCLVRRAPADFLPTSSPVMIAAMSLIIALSIAGCAAGPDYRKPSATLQPFHAPAALSSRRTRASAPALAQWWLGFADPELTRIAQRVLNQNLGLTAAIARVEQARAAAPEAGAQLLPTADLTAQAARIHQSLESPLGSIARHLPGFERDPSEYDVGAAASWEIELFGGLRRGAQAARAEAQAAEAEQLGTRITVVADAADAYLQVRGDQARIALAKDQVSTDEHLLDLVERRFRAGLATDREEAQAQSLLSEARASLQPLAIDLEAQLNRLDVLMGAQPGTYAAELSSRQEIPLPPAIPSDVTPADVLRRRPD